MLTSAVLCRVLNADPPRHYSVEASFYSLCPGALFAMEEIICICSIPVLYAMSFGLGRIIDTVLETRWPTDI